MNFDRTKEAFETATDKYIETLKKCSDGRDHSWEHCYSKFYHAISENVYDEITVDNLSLHLAFYLASWGMYRGSSFVLNKDYTIHRKAVGIVMKPEYKTLLGIKCEEYRDESNLNKLEKIKNELQAHYGEIRDNVFGKKSCMPVSDTLISKILLGTLGCVPAYDSFFITAIREYDVAPRTFSNDSIRELVGFYMKMSDFFEKKQKETEFGEVLYPHMKIMDMGFWQLGYEINSREKENELSVFGGDIIC